MEKYDKKCGACLHCFEGRDDCLNNEAYYPKSSKIEQLKSENAVLRKALELIKKENVCEFCQGRAHYKNQKVDVDYFIQQAEQEINGGKK